MRDRIRASCTYRALAICNLICVAILGLVAARPVVAQQDVTGWSPPEVIVRTEGQLAASGMALVADPAGQLHLFYSHQPGESVRGSIDCVHWDGSDWSQPVDIMVEPGGFSPRSVRAAIDPQSVVHLVWLGDNGALRHASAPLTQASSVRAWSAPQAIASVTGETDIIAGSDGTLYVAYAGWPSLSTVSLIRSTDGGASWSQPSIVASTAPETAPNEVRLALDGAGRLHVTWTEYQLPDGWPPTGAFYTRSTDKGVTWETPLQIAEPSHGQIGVGTVGNDEVHLVWRSTIQGDGTFHQWSTDGGETWSLPDRFDDRGGFSGLPSFALDTVGRLHYVIGPVFHAMWDGNRLSEYEDVATQRVRATAERSSGERAAIAVTSGNRLHVVFEIDFNRLWHTSKQLDAPPLPTPTSSPAVVSPIPTKQPAAIVTVQPDNATAQPRVTVVVPLGDGQPKAMSANMVLVLGLAPSVLIVVMVVLGVLLKRRP